MLKPTNDPIAVARRRQEEAERVNREALAANGSQPAQGLRKLMAMVQQILDLVLRMPWNDGRQVDTDGWSLTDPGTWKTVASTTIPRPADKTRVVVSVNADVTALTTISEFGRSAFDTRIVINGVESGVKVGAMEPPGVQYQRCTAYPAFVREIAGLAGEVTVELQARGTPYSAITSSNKASLSVVAGFSRI
ncbi:hypothetical protein MPMin1_gp52 [Microbacterium phage Min1]|uniref:Uncharacterized protein n=1 Tax=Microbacterium phage Min1 TaxID=446529 RepID=A6N210_9CAUD|nr:hypothetical protein MPMin1_gp52 [Microbacterium phage Min1]ABR10482.1 hypothetical protein [Microbacterium phage Min1]